MKIISKTKDFYDWVVGIYGEDPKMVYDRRIKDQFIFSKYLKENNFNWDGWKDKEGKFYWIDGWILIGNKIWDFSFHPLLDPSSDSKNPKFKFEWRSPQDLIYKFDNEKHSVWTKPKRPRDGEIVDREKILESVSIKKFGRYFYDYVKLTEEERRIPVMLKIENHGLELNPILKGTPLESFIPAESAFLAIQDYLGSLKDMSPEDERDDIQKLESAGFDKKTSFRKM